MFSEHNNRQQFFPGDTIIPLSWDKTAPIAFSAASVSNMNPPRFFGKKQQWPIHYSRLQHLKGGFLPTDKFYLGPC